MAAGIGLVDMLNDDEIEIERLEIWDRVLRADGKCLHPGQERHLAIVRKRVQMLDLLRQHREAFVELVEKARKAKVS